MICDLPTKILTSIFFNLTLYFLTNLRREPGAFFIFYLFSFVTALVMSMVFRSIGAMSRTLAQAMAPAAVFILALIIYTGFTVPIRGNFLQVMRMQTTKCFQTCTRGLDGSITLTQSRTDSRLS